MKVTVEVPFDSIVLQDNEEDGMLTGNIRGILYKGDHYHLTVASDWDEDVSLTPTMYGTKATT